jgi:hypothetical protein
VVRLLAKEPEWLSKLAEDFLRQLQNDGVRFGDADALADLRAHIAPAQLSKDAKRFIQRLVSNRRYSALAGDLRAWAGNPKTPRQQAPKSPVLDRLEHLVSQLVKARTATAVEAVAAKIEALDLGEAFDEDADRADALFVKIQSRIETTEGALSRRLSDVLDAMSST